MNTTYYSAEKRGGADHGRLRTAHSFSFGSYHNPKNLGFGALRVLNDDRIAAGKGFSAHPHQDMEIISLVTDGSLQHQDNIGSTGIIGVGDIQVMSAGSGVVHSEKNASTTNPVSIFQIWIETRTQGIPPRYEQKHFNGSEYIDKQQLLVSPDGDQGSLIIMQDAWITRIRSSSSLSGTYTCRGSQTGAYCFQISGGSIIAEHTLNSRDAVSITQTNTIKYQIQENSNLLIIEVPLF